MPGRTALTHSASPGPLTPGNADWLKNTVVGKPFEIHALRATVRQVLGAPLTRSLRLALPLVPAMHPTYVRHPFHPAGWVYEEKYNGWRPRRRAARCTGAAGREGRSAWQ